MFNLLSVNNDTYECILVTQSILYISIFVIFIMFLQHQRYYYSYITSEKNLMLIKNSLSKFKRQDCEPSLSTPTAVFLLPHEARWQLYSLHIINEHRSPVHLVRVSTSHLPWEYAHVWPGMCNAPNDDGFSSLPSHGTKLSLQCLFCMFPSSLINFPWWLTSSVNISKAGPRF